MIFIFKQLIKNFSTITFIGICKNAGKTTALNKLLDELVYEIVGITSIGRDGESLDLATSTKKPEIYIRRGTIFATARGMLRLCDATVEVLEITNHFTPFGEIVVFRALSDGFVQIAGPSSVLGISEVIDIMKNYGAKRVLVDGAASRKSLANAKSDSTAIFCVGASLDKSIQKTIDEAEHIINLFESEIININTSDKNYSFFDENLNLLYESDEIVYKDIKNNAKYIYISGAVTTKIVTDIYKKGFKLKIITQDATHFLCDRISKEQYFLRGGEFYVTKSINISAVTVNPWSAYGNHFDSDEFLSEISKKTDLPVINVMEESI